MKGRAQLGEPGPLRHRFEMIDRLDRLDLDDAEQLAAALVLADEVWKPRARSRWRSGDRRGLFVAWIDGDVELSLIFRLQQANDAVVLELLPDWPDENWA